MTRGNAIFNPASWLPKPPQQRSRRSFVEATGDQIRDEWLQMYKPEHIQVVEMSPETFLRLTLPPGEKHRIKKTMVKRVADRMDADLEIDTPYLDIDVATNTVTAHNGRHRAAAAQMLGIPVIPVVLIMHHGRSCGAINLVAEPEYRFTGDVDRDLVPQWMGRSIRCKQ